MALAEKDVPYELIEVPFGMQREPQHLARHPFARVPAFEHDGFCLYETQAILRYLDDVFPAPPLQPAAAKLRARMNQQMGILDAYGWPSIVGGILYNRWIAPRLGLPVDDNAVVAALPRAKLCVREWERLMEGRMFLAGDDLSLADILVAPPLVYFRRTAEGEAALRDHAALAAWCDRIRARDAFVACTPPPLPPS